MARRAAAVLVAAALLLAGAPAPASAAAMRAPPRPPVRPAAPRLETSSLALAAEAVLGVYRRRISPITAGRCGFSPSCSTYALAAVRRLGPVRGAGAIGDRLIRCNLFKGPRDYPLLPSGRLWDPLEEGGR